MRKIVPLFIFISFLTGCASPTATPTLGPTATLTIPAPSRTLPPSATPSPTLTPLPTIPTFTPTFDARTIVTVTPAANAECPKEDDSIEIDLTVVNQYAPNDATSFIEAAQQRGGFILNLLNKGLKISSFLNELKNQQFEYSYKDINGDNIKDVVVSDLGRFHIFYCAKGIYKLFTNNRFYNSLIAPKIEMTDLNKNGLPEITLPDYILGKRGSFNYSIDEWNGKEFVDVALNPKNGQNPEMFGPQNFEFKDINHDGLKDLVFTGDGPWDEDLLSRTKTVVYTWNGKFYGETYISFAERQYRFQAIQDADRELLYGNYEKALSLYQEAIFNEKLEWWSHERQQYVIDTYASQYDPTPTVYPTLIPDLTEYPRLAAYAYYRVVMLHTHLGEIDAAQTQYATLQAKFPAGSPAHPYAEMADAFFAAYRATQKMYIACAAAIAYADAHPEILTPLGSDYHGWQSHTYTPADVCPFR